MATTASGQDSEAIIRGAIPPGFAPRGDLKKVFDQLITDGARQLDRAPHREAEAIQGTQELVKRFASYADRRPFAPGEEISFEHIKSFICPLFPFCK